MPFTNSQEKGRPITILDEGISLTTNVGSIDLTGAGISSTAIGTAVTVVVSGGVGTQVNNEIPSGTINGTNVTFTLANTPIAGTLKLRLNGMWLQSGVDYTLAGTTITFINPPETGSNLYADYGY